MQPNTTERHAHCRVARSRPPTYPPTRAWAPPPPPPPAPPPPNREMVRPPVEFHLYIHLSRNGSYYETFDYRYFGTTTVNRYTDRYPDSQRSNLTVHGKRAPGKPRPPGSCHVGQAATVAACGMGDRPSGGAERRVEPSAPPAARRCRQSHCRTRHLRRYNGRDG